METPNEDINVSYDARIWLLEEDAVAPTRWDEELPVGSINLGDTTVEGEAFSRSITLGNRKVHQKGKTVRQLVEDYTQTLAASFAEGNPTVRGLYYGAFEVDGVITSSNKVIKRTIVCDQIDEEYNSVIRYVAYCSITPNGDLTYTETEFTTYPLLFTAMGDVKVMNSKTTPVAP